MEDPTRPEPFFYLGQLHESGSGVTRDLKSAFQYYRRGAKLEHVESLVKCGDFLYSGRGMPSFNSSQKAYIPQRKDRIEAFKCYKKASDAGNPRGMNNCGLMYESGFEGVAPDPERASQLYRQAHKLGNLDATVNLAFFYLNVSSLDGGSRSKLDLTKLACLETGPRKRGQHRQGAAQIRLP